MEKNKKNAVTVRFEKEEKAFLEKKAEQQCMSISQYIKYIVLEQKDEIKKAESELRSDEYLKKMSRNILFLRSFGDIFIRKFLSDKEANEVARQANILFDQYGIGKSAKK